MIAGHITMREAAERAGVTLAMVSSWYKKGLIKATKFGDRVLAVDEKSFNDHMKSLAETAIPEGYITMREAAAKAKVTADTIKKWGQHDLIENLRLPSRRVFIKTSSLDKFLADAPDPNLWASYRKAAHICKVKESTLRGWAESGLVASRADRVFGTHLVELDSVRQYIGATGYVHRLKKEEKEELPKVEVAEPSTEELPTKDEWLTCLEAANLANVRSTPKIRLRSIDPACLNRIADALEHIANKLEVK